MRKFRTFSDILSGLQSGNITSKEVELTRNEAKKIFGENIVYLTEGMLVINIKWKEDTAIVRVSKTE